VRSQSRVRAARWRHLGSSCTGRLAEQVGRPHVSADRRQCGSCWWPGSRTPNPRPVSR
jgi:hypothetical protein